MKKIILFVFLLITVAYLPACSNTVHGAGQDIEGMGKWMKSSVE